MPDEYAWPEAAGWQVRYSLEFLEQMESEPWRSRRAEVVSHLRTRLTDPLNALNSERLVRDHRGLRSARLGWRFRFLFKLCGECRAHEDQSRFTLDCCIDDQTSNALDSTINLLYVSDHYGNTPGGFTLDELPEPEEEA